MADVVAGLGPVQDEAEVFDKRCVSDVDCKVGQTHSSFPRSADVVLALLLFANGSCWILGDIWAVVKPVGVDNAVNVVVEVFSRSVMTSSILRGCTPSAPLVPCLVGVHDADEGGNGSSHQKIGVSDFPTPHALACFVVRKRCTTIQARVTANSTM